MKKRLITIIILLIIGVGITLFLRQNGAEQPARKLTYYGNVEIRDARLAFDEQGLIDAVLVEEGDRIKAGQLLARLKGDKLKALLDQATAQLRVQEQLLQELRNGPRQQEIGQAIAEVEAARVALDNDRTSLQRIAETAAFGASSRQALDDAEAAVKVGEAQLQVKTQALALLKAGTRSEELARAEAQLEAYRANQTYLEQRLQATELHAPQAGVIQSRLLEAGEMAGPSLPVLSVALDAPKWVRIYLPEPDLGLVRVGARAGIVCDSFPSRSFSGHLGFISSVAEFTPKTVETTDLRTKLVYEARIVVDEGSELLKLGMPVTVILEEQVR